MHLYLAKLINNFKIVTSIYKKLGMWYARHLWTLNLPFGPNKPKSQVLFHNKRPTQDYFSRTLVVPVLPLDFRFWLSFPFAKSHVFIVIKVLIFCVEFRELSHLTRDLSRAEKKIIDVTSWSTDKMTTIFTQNDNFNHFEWNRCHFVCLLSL